MPALRTNAATSSSSQVALDALLWEGNLTAAGLGHPAITGQHQPAKQELHFGSVSGADTMTKETRATNGTDRKIANASVKNNGTRDDEPFAMHPPPKRTQDADTPAGPVRHPKAAKGL